MLVSAIHWTAAGQLLLPVHYDSRFMRVIKCELDSTIIDLVTNYLTSIHNHLQSATQDHHRVWLTNRDYHSFFLLIEIQMKSRISYNTCDYKILNLRGKKKKTIASAENNFNHFSFIRSNFHMLDAYINVIGLIFIYALHNMRHAAFAAHIINIS